MAVVIHERQNVTKAGRFQSSNFNIASTSEAFQILSDKLYSNKVRAVIRELSTNARDAHKAVNNMGTPFKVHLPTMAEPHFSIRDFGVGLSIQVYDQDPTMVTDVLPIFEGSYVQVETFLANRQDADKLFVLDEAMSMYTTYFYSNKVHSNDFIGQLGLGSKSPFAYTDTFQVVVYYHGEKRMYNCQLNADKIPEISHVKAATEITQEHDGVEVSFAAKYNSFNDFYREAYEVYQYFDDLCPEVTGIADWIKPVRQYIFEAKDGTWGIRKNSAGANVLMGNIAYPISRGNLTELSSEQQGLLSLAVELKLPIGSCDITPSREQLSYKQRTIDSIKNKLDEMLAELSGRITTKFEDAPSLWEARCLAYELFFKVGSELNRLTEIVKIRQVEWHGQQIDVLNLSVAGIAGVTVNRFVGERSHRGGYWNRQERGIRCKRGDNVSRVSPERDVIWYENDLVRGANSRIQQLIHEEKAKKAYLVTFEDAVAKQNFLKVIGFSANTLIKVSTLPKCDVKRTQVYHKTNEEVFEHNGATSSPRLYDFWKATEVDLADGGVYIPLLRYKGIDGAKEVHPSRIGEIMKVMTQVGFSVPKVIGVRPSTVKAFRKNSDWVDFFTWARGIVKQYCISADLDRKIANCKMLSKIDGSRGELWKILGKFDFDPTGVMNGFLSKFKEMTNNTKGYEKYETYACVFEWIGLTRNTYTAKYDLEAEEKKVLSKYLMLDLYLEERYTYHTFSAKHIQTICSYIRELDGQTVEAAVASQDDSF